MKPIAKYNTYKGVSTVLTVGTPIITLCSCSNLFIHRSETAISAAGLFSILLTILLFKDKIAENFKMPSASAISLGGLVAILLIENLIEPVKYVCMTTLATSVVDELSFKRMYKNLESLLPSNVFVHKHAGFIFGTSNSLLGGNDDAG